VTRLHLVAVAYGIAASGVALDIIRSVAEDTDESEGDL
jgi:hypothetical protein